MSRPNTILNRRNLSLNLRRALTRAVAGPTSVKEVARFYGISPREVSKLRAEACVPRVPTFLEIAKRDPQLRAHVIAILSGEAEASSSANIDALVRTYVRGER